MRVDSIELKESGSPGHFYVWLTGSKGGWITSENLCDVYEVSGFLVAISPKSTRPMFVVKDRDELMNMVKTITGKQSLQR